MDIVVDGKIQKISFDKEIDDEDTIKHQLSVLMNIPWSFIIVKEQEDEYIVSTALKYIPKTPNDISNSFKKAKVYFPKITPLEFGCYCILSENFEYSKNNVYFYELNKANFGTQNSLQKSLKFYKESYDSKNSLFEKKREFLVSYKKKYQKYDLVTAREMKVSKNIYEINIGDDDDYIFDQLRPSKKMPLIIYSKAKTKFFKVHSGTTYDPSWALFADSELSDGIYFKIANLSSERLSLDYLKVETKFSDGFILNGVARIYFNSFFGLDENYVDSFFSKFENKSKIQVVGVDGSFLVDIPYYEKNLWSDFISTSKMFSQIFFCNEIFNTFSMKTRTTFYYDIFNSLKEDTREAIPFTITHKNDKTYSIYIRKARTIQELTVIGSIICRALSYFQDGELLFDLKSTYRPFKVKFPEEVGKKKVLLRKGERVGLLNKLYGGDVSRKCPSKRQPTTIRKDQIAEYKKKFGEDTVLETKDYNWVCMNPEDDEPSDFKFIGYQLDKSKAEERCIPCCFSVNQFTKKSSKIGSCLRKENGEEVGPQIKKSGIGYIIETGKELGEDRYGDNPVNIKKILEMLEWPTFKKDESKKYFRLLRHGAPATNDSIIHCFLMALDRAYEKERDKKNYVSQIRKEMSERDELLPLCKQSAFDYEIEDLKEILSDPENEVEAEIFLTFLEAYFSCNCFVVVISKKNPEGEIFFPRYQGVYIQSPYVYEKSIVVVKSESEAGKCSVLRQVSFESRASYGSYVLEDMGEKGERLKEIFSGLRSESQKLARL